VAEPEKAGSDPGFNRLGSSGHWVRAESVTFLLQADARYLPPPTTVNVGLATTILAGSDQDICCAFVGRE
jgi:hypothetical protein